MLSTVNLITDVYRTVQFFNREGQEGYVKTNAILIGLTMTVQIYFVYAQNSKKLRLFCQDLAAILSGFKPALELGQA